MTHDLVVYCAGFASAVVVAWIWERGRARERALGHVFDETKGMRE